MATTKEDLSEWFDQGVQRGATHMIVVCDTFDYEDYPVYVTSQEDARKKKEAYDKGEHPMQKVMEVYCLTRDKASQLAERRSFNFEP